MSGRKIFAQDSFELLGSGFHYIYDHHENRLNIECSKRLQKFATLTFDHKRIQNPRAFVSALDKTNQIKALIYSNNATVNLAETMEEPEKIASLLQTALKTSGYTYDLMHQQYDHFSEDFCAAFGLKSLRLKKYQSTAENRAYYAAKLQTQHNNAISVQGCSLPVLTQALADKTLRDLISMEFGHSFGNSAQNLMNVASKLSIIGRVLDKDFFPEKRLRKQSITTNKGSESA